MSNLVELKPCPFCGQKEAKFQHYDVLENGEVGEFCGIRCQYCGINFFTDGTESETIREWNIRLVRTEGDVCLKK